MAAAAMGATGGADSVSEVGSTEEVSLAPSPQHLPNGSPSSSPGIGYAQPAPPADHGPQRRSNRSVSSGRALVTDGRGTAAGARPRLRTTPVHHRTRSVEVLGTSGSGPPNAGTVRFMSASVVRIASGSTGQTAAASRSVSDRAEHRTEAPRAGWQGDASQDEMRDARAPPLPARVYRVANEGPRTGSSSPPEDASDVSPSYRHRPEDVGSQSSNASGSVVDEPSAPTTGTDRGKAPMPQGPEVEAEAKGGAGMGRARTTPRATHAGSALVEVYELQQAKLAAGEAGARLLPEIGRSSSGVARGRGR